MATVDEEVKLTQADADAMLTQGEKDVTASNTMYDGMVTKNETAMNDALGLIETNKANQTEIANQQTDFAIEKIEQQKDQAKKDYTKEQSGAYVDWQKQSNQYGANAEQRASAGMANTGYAESAQVSMYNQYQNRITAARESYNQAVLNYNNAIKDAQLQNSSILAEIAAQALEKSLEITLTYTQQNNALLQAKANAAMQIKAQAHSNYIDVLNQINAQNSLAESKRHNEATEKLASDQFEWQKDQANKTTTGLTVKGGSGSTGGNKLKTGSGTTSKNWVARVLNNSKSSSGSSKEETKEKESGSTPFNMQSIVDAFGGARSPAYIEDKVAKGEAKIVVINGERHVVRTVPLPTSKYTETKSYAGTRNAKGMVFGKNILTKKD